MSSSSGTWTSFASIILDSNLLLYFCLYLNACFCNSVFGIALFLEGSPFAVNVDSDPLPEKDPTLCFSGLVSSKISPISCSPFFFLSADLYLEALLVTLLVLHSSLNSLNFL